MLTVRATENVLYRSREFPLKSEISNPTRPPLSLSPRPQIGPKTVMFLFTGATLLSFRQRASHFLFYANNLHIITTDAAFTLLTICKFCDCNDVNVLQIPLLNICSEAKPYFSISLNWGTEKLYQLLLSPICARFSAKLSIFAEMSAARK